MAYKLVAGLSMCRLIGAGLVFAALAFVSSAANAAPADASSELGELPVAELDSLATGAPCLQVTGLGPAQLAALKAKMKTRVEGVAGPHAATCAAMLRQLPKEMSADLGGRGWKLEKEWPPRKGERLRLVFYRRVTP